MHLGIKDAHFAVCTGGARMALFLGAGYTLRRRWFRDTRLWHCPLNWSTASTVSSGGWMGTTAKRRLRLCSPPGSPRAGMLPSLKRKLPKCSPHQQHTGRCSVCSQESAFSFSHWLLWVWTRTPAYLVLGTPVGRNGAPSTAPQLWQPQQDHCGELPLRIDDSILTRLLSSAFHGELP